MLHVWLIPAVAVFCFVLVCLYLVIKRRGGSGVRSEGKTLVDKPGEDEDPPPG